MILGIDIGTSSIKLTLLDSQRGTAFTGAKEPLTLSVGMDGRSELDVLQLWKVLLSCFEEMRAAYPAEVKRVKAVGISVFFPTLLILDKVNNPLCNLFLYNDLRSQKQVDCLLKSHPEIEKMTGNRLCSGTSLLPGIVWLNEHRPELMKQVACCTQLGDYVGWKLCGNHQLDSTQVSLSALASAGKEESWNDELLQIAGVAREQLPPICHGGTVIGTLEENIARTSGIPAGVPVVCASGDAPLAALAGGVIRAGQAFVAVGSTDCLVFSGRKPTLNPLFCNVRHILPELWLSIGTMTTAGHSVHWFCDEVMHCSNEEMTRWALEANPGANGVVFLPFLQGERTPYWDARLRGGFQGLGLVAGRNEMARAVLEGVACGWRQILSLQEEATSSKVTSIVCAGGGSANSLWNRIKASMLKCPIDVMNTSQASGLGACLAAGLGTKLFADPSQALEIVASLRKTERFEPVPEWEAVLDELYSRYVILAQDALQRCREFSR